MTLRMHSKFFILTFFSSTQFYVFSLSPFNHFAVNFELPAPRLKGPSAADIEAASDMSAEDREDFIRLMVAQLSDRLATEGGSAAEWARLISSYGILGEVENAKIIWTEAQAVFGSDQAAMEQLRAAAKSAGAIE
jgi:cytochrome c-type biogenesis protein CcmH